MNAFRKINAVDQVESIALADIIDKSSASLDGVVRLRWCRQGRSNRWGAAEQVLISTRSCSAVIEPLPLQKLRAVSIEGDQLSNEGLLPHDTWAVGHECLLGRWWVGAHVNCELSRFFGIQKACTRGGRFGCYDVRRQTC